MEKQTSDLENELLHTSDIKVYCQNNAAEFIEPSLPDYLNELLVRKNKSKADVIKASGLQNIYAYQIFTGMKRPHRDKVLALAFGFRLSLDEVQDLLKKTEYKPLYVRIKRDAYIIHCLNEHYSIDETNAFLERQGEDQLFYVE